MTGLRKNEGELTSGLDWACTKVFVASDICASYVRPVANKKISLTQVNKDFNHEIKVDFTVTYISDEKHEVQKMVDMGTSLS